MKEETTVESAVTTKFRAHLEQQIETGRDSALGVVARIQREVPTDRLVASRMIDLFEHGPGTYKLQLPDGVQEPLHTHAFGQVAERVGVPMDYVRKLETRGDTGRALVVHNLRTLYRHDPAKTVLTRSVNGEVRGFLSDKFKRLDSRPIVDAFIGAAMKHGAQPFDGTAGDTRFAIRAVVPRVYEVVPGEALAFGVSLSTSDYGNGALSLRTFVWRCFCANLATLEEALRQVHLGRRLGDDMTVFRQETINQETRATAMMVDDITRGALDVAKIEQSMGIIRKANETPVDTRSFFASLRTTYGLLKGEAEKVRDTFNGGGIEELPPGNTFYRMSNAVSWIAKSAESPERKLELETVAGRVLLAA
jgi:hypothetical protein